MEIRSLDSLFKEVTVFKVAIPIASTFFRVSQGIALYPLFGGVSHNHVDVLKACGGGYRKSRLLSPL